MEFKTIEAKVKENGEKIGFLNKRVFKELANVISDNEKLYFAVGGTMKKHGVIAMGVTSIKIHIITEPNAGMALSAIIIPLNRITSVSSTGGVFGGDIQISEGTIVHIIKSVLPAIATKAVNAINQALSEQTSSQPSSQLSQADELLKFKKLLDDGVLTQDEFDRKKAQILSL